MPVAPTAAARPLLASLDAVCAAASALPDARLWLERLEGPDAVLALCLRLPSGSQRALVVVSGGSVRPVGHGLPEPKRPSWSLRLVEHLAREILKGRVEPLDPQRPAPGWQRTSAQALVPGLSLQAELPLELLRQALAPPPVAQALDPESRAVLAETVRQLQATGKLSAWWRCDAWSWETLDLCVRPSDSAEVVAPVVRLDLREGRLSESAWYGHPAGAPLDVQALCGAIARQLESAPARSVLRQIDRARRRDFVSVNAGH
jgi:hypothetical protein